MKNIFLFGAGASHGSNGLNTRPPLGNQLFTALSNCYPRTWGCLPNNLSALFHNNFEKGMEFIWKNYSSNISILMKDMAVYFSNFILTDVNENLYSKIILNIYQKKILPETLFSTINYDCIIEFASLKLNINFGYIGFRCGSQIDVKVLIAKLHGSCNFVSNNIQATKNIAYSKGIVFDTKLKVIEPVQVSSYCYENNSLYPAMSIYMRNKPLQIAPTIIKNIQSFWKKVLLDSQKVFIIGVHPNQDDQHLWQPLSQTKGKLFFCGDKESYSLWQTSVQRSDYFIGETFDEGLPNILKEL